MSQRELFLEMIAAADNVVKVGAKDADHPAIKRFNRAKDALDDDKKKAAKKAPKKAAKKAAKKKAAKKAPKKKTAKKSPKKAANAARRKTLRAQIAKARCAQRVTMRTVLQKRREHARAIKARDRAGKLLLSAELRAHVKKTKGAKCSLASRAALDRKRALGRAETEIARVLAALQRAELANKKSGERLYQLQQELINTLR